MSKVWKTVRLCNRACKRFTGLTATSSKREAGCRLHGMFPEKLEEMTGYHWISKSCLIFPF